jgi:predicted O-methyltransferase YrrM
VDSNVNDEDTKGVRLLNDFVKNQRDLYSTLLPIRDGINVIIKK